MTIREAVERYNEINNEIAEYKQILENIKASVKFPEDRPNVIITFEEATKFVLLITEEIRRLDKQLDKMIDGENHF